MEINIVTDRKIDTDEYLFLLEKDLKELHSKDLKIEMKSKEVTLDSDDVVNKGIVEITTLIVSMIGAGGFLSVAASKGGLFTKIAEIFVEHQKRDIHFKIKSKKGKEIELKGPVNKIKELIEEILLEEYKK